MTELKKIERLLEILDTVLLVNNLLLEIHDLPILAKLNREINIELEHIKK